MSKLANIKPKQIIKVLKDISFEERRQTGSHLILKNSTTNKITVVPIHPRNLKTGIIRIIIKQSGLPRKEFLEMLGK